MSAPAVSRNYDFRQTNPIARTCQTYRSAWIAGILFRDVLICSIVSRFRLLDDTGAGEFAETFQPRRNQPIGRKIALDVSIVSVVTHSNLS